MTYPTSSDVSAGQPTSYLHYNSLRADALTLGQLPADAVSLGAALSRFQDNLVLVPLATDRLSVPYDALQPCVLMIDGHLCQAAAQVDLAPGLFSGLAATWYVFAVWTAGANTFSLTVNTSATEAAGQRRIAQINWDGSHLVYPSLWVYAQGRPGLMYAKVSRAAAQSINSGAPTAISFDTEETDQNGMFTLADPTKITIVNPGLYLVQAQAALTTTNLALATYLKLNGATVLAANLAGAMTGAQPFSNLALLYVLAAADYLQLQVMHVKGSADNTAAPTNLKIVALSA